MEASPMWQELHDDLKALSAVLRSHELRDRFSKTCLQSSVHKRLFERYVGKHVSWKWEFLQMFLVRLQPLLPVMQAHFDVAKITGALVLNDVGAAVIRRCRQALDRPGIRLRVHIARCVSRAADKVAVWCEGCACHEHLLQGGEGSSRKRKMNFAKASIDCPWKGCRGPELASGKWKVLVGNIAGASDPWLQEEYAEATAAQRCAGADFEKVVKDCHCFHKKQLKQQQQQQQQQQQLSC